MKLLFKIIIIVVIIGALLALCSLFLTKFDIDLFDSNEFVERDYEVTGSFDKIDLDSLSADIIFAPSENGKTHVKCLETETLTYSVEIDGDTLMIRTKDSRKWFDFLRFTLSTKKMTVYLDQTSYKELKVNSTTGDVRIPADFSFENVDISGTTASIVCRANVSEKALFKTTTGNIHVSSLDGKEASFSAATGSISLDKSVISGSCTMKVTTGGIEIENVTCGELDAKCSTGDIDLESVSVSENVLLKTTTGDIDLENVVAGKQLKMETTTGEIEFERVDGNTIEIENKSGHVEGSILSSKIFVTETSTGTVHVPDSIEGGKCKISTTTGDVNITIVDQK